MSEEVKKKSKEESKVTLTPEMKKEKHRKVSFITFLAIDILLVVLIAYQIISVFMGS